MDLGVLPITAPVESIRGSNTESDQVSNSRPINSEQSSPTEVSRTENLTDSVPAESESLATDSPMNDNDAGVSNNDSTNTDSVGNEGPVRTNMVTRSSTGIFKPNPKFALTASASEISVPKSAKSALLIPQWKDAMIREFNALQDNGTWTLVPRLPEDNVINTKWVFKVKTKADGTVEHFKARLVANGIRQIYGADYFDTFSPVVRPLSIRLVLLLTISKGWVLRQIDVSNAFLHGNLKERIVVSQPYGFIDNQNSDQVCLLRKSLYGLKQSLRCWF